MIYLILLLENLRIKGAVQVLLFYFVVYMLSCHLFEILLLWKYCSLKQQQKWR